MVNLQSNKKRREVQAAKGSPACPGQSRPGKADGRPGESNSGEPNSGRGARHFFLVLFGFCLVFTSFHMHMWHNAMPSWRISWPKGSPACQGRSQPGTADGRPGASEPGRGARRGRSAAQAPVAHWSCSWGGSRLAGSGAVSWHLLLPACTARSSSVVRRAALLVPAAWWLCSWDGSRQAGSGTVSWHPQQHACTWKYLKTEKISMAHQEDLLSL